MAAYNFNGRDRDYQTLVIFHKFGQNISDGDISQEKFLCKKFEELIWNKGKATLTGENVDLQLCGQFTWHCEIIDSDSGEEKKHYYFDCAEVNASVCAELLDFGNFEWKFNGIPSGALLLDREHPSSRGVKVDIEQKPVLVYTDELVEMFYLVLTIWSACVYLMVAWVEHEMARAGKAICIQFTVLLAGLACQPCVHLTSKEVIIDLCWVNFGFFLASLKSFVMTVCWPILLRRIFKKPAMSVNTDSLSSACGTVFLIVFAILAFTISHTRKRRRHTVDASTELNQVEIQKFSA